MVDAGLTEQAMGGESTPTRSSIDRVVARAYGESNPEAGLSNDDLYAMLGDEFQTQFDFSEQTPPLGRAGTRHSKAKRTARWSQQTLKVQGLIENVGRGRWRMTREGRKKLTRPFRGFMLLAFNTDLGAGVWGDCRDLGAGLQEEVTLCLTSPPYPLRHERAYGNVAEGRYVDWLCEVLEPTIRRLRRGGNLALVLGNEVFMPRSPARSLYIERLTLALCERFGLSLMDRLTWHNPSKSPGPVRWTSLERVQLNASYEHILWFCSDPSCVIADNRRVLQPHTERHKALMARGGESRSATYGDGAYRLRPGRSFAHETPGRIPRNVLEFGHVCASQKAYKTRAREMGLPVHGAPAPLALGRFMVRYLSEKGSLVADPMAGSFTFPLAAELEGRRWVASERMGEYVYGASTRFEDQPGFRLNPAMPRLASVFDSTSVGR